MPRTSLKAASALYAPAVLVLLVTAVSAVHYAVPVGSLTRDMATVAGVNPFTGFLSNLGILLWCAAAAVSLFAAAAMRGRGDRRQARFLYGFALLTAFLLIDDFFMFHDYVAPEILGIRERYVMAGYLAVTAGLLFAFRKEILGSDFFLFGLALFFFALSVGMDKIHHGKWSWLFLGEDGAKFLGLVGWAGYFVRHSYSLICGRAVAETNPQTARVRELEPGGECVPVNCAAQASGINQVL